jgi:uncharacterized membrane protein YhaH (DUF805 family)
MSSDSLDPEIVGLLQTIIRAATVIIIVLIIAPTVKFCVRRAIDVRDREDERDR